MTTVFFTKVFAAISAAYPKKLHKKQHTLSKYIYRTADKEDADCAEVTVDPLGLVTVEPSAWRMRQTFRSTTFRLSQIAPRSRYGNALANAADKTKPFNDVAAVDKFIKTRLKNIIARMTNIDALCAAQLDRRSEALKKTQFMINATRDALASVYGVTFKKPRNAEARWDGVVEDRRFDVNDSVAGDGVKPSVTANHSHVLLEVSFDVYLSLDRVQKHPRVIAAIYEVMRNSQRDLADKVNALMAASGGVEDGD